MSSNVIDFCKFREGLQVTEHVREDKVDEEELKKYFFQHLDLVTKTLEEKIQLFVDDFFVKEPMKKLAESRGCTIQEILVEWKKEYDESIIIDKRTEIIIERRVKELSMQRYVEKDVLGILEHEFKDVHINFISIREFIQKKLDEFHNRNIDR